LPEKHFICASKAYACHVCTEKFLGIHPINSAIKRTLFFQYFQHILSIGKNNEWGQRKTPQAEGREMWARDNPQKGQWE
jgi:hypothetical protein